MVFDMVLILVMVLLVLCSRFYGFEMVLRLMEIGLFQQVMVL